MSTKKASEIIPGDVVITEADDKPVRVTNVGKGWSGETVMIHWRGGWACINKRDEIVLSEPAKS